MGRFAAVLLGTLAFLAALTAPAAAVGVDPSALVPAAEIALEGAGITV
ncbi:MAG TPA: hypothetical protein VE546_02840 [Streptomyces sp.]|nr:hypothetical protein [Streptomyces sp.]HZG02510.1 hypothetical protein [Streptomyces sp.]